MNRGPSIVGIGGTHRPAGHLNGRGALILGAEAAQLGQRQALLKQDAVIAMVPAPSCDASSLCSLWLA